MSTENFGAEAVSYAQKLGEWEKEMNKRRGPNEPKIIVENNVLKALFSANTSFFTIKRQTPWNKISKNSWNFFHLFLHIFKFELFI